MSYEKKTEKKEKRRVVATVGRKGKARMHFCDREWERKKETGKEKVMVRGNGKVKEGRKKRRRE